MFKVFVGRNATATSTRTRSNCSKRAPRLIDGAPDPVRLARSPLH
jgi:hypothetical protein